MLTPLPSDTPPRSPRYFGQFVLDPVRGALTRDGQEIPLRPKSFAVLWHLVANAGRLVSKKELLDTVWGHTYVSEGSLGQCLMDIRRALEDEAHEVIRTVPRRGYLFELPVSTLDPKPGRNDPPRDPENIPPARVARYGLAVGAGLAVLALVWFSASSFRSPDNTMHGVGPYSVVVLPFVDLSPNGDQEYFSDGLTEELINALTQVEGIQVIARTSSFALKGSGVDIPTIVERLGVSHVLEGSVRKAGTEVRITAQLIDGGTNAHVWSRSYDRTLDDIFAVQGDIARAVANSLEVSLSVSGEASIAGVHDPAAYEHFLQAQYFWRRQGDGDIDRAEEQYRKALAIDPEFADAWAGLAGVMNVRITDGQVGVKEGAAEQRRMLQRALSINPSMPEAMARLAGNYFAQGDRETADRYWARALELGGDNAFVQSMASSWAAWRGLYGEAIERGQKAVSLDPLAANFRNNLAIYLLADGRLEEAAREFRQSHALSPNAPPGQAQDFRDRIYDLALIEILQGRAGSALELIQTRQGGLNQDQITTLAFIAQGRIVEANEAIARIRALGSVQAELRLAEIDAFRGNPDSALERLRAINDSLDPVGMHAERRILLDIRKSPLFISLRDDPRWGALWKKWQHRM